MVPFFVVIFSVGNYTASVKYCTPAWVWYIVLVIYFPGHMGYSTFYLFFMLICFFSTLACAEGKEGGWLATGGHPFLHVLYPFVFPPSQPGPLLPHVSLSLVAMVTGW